MPPRLIAPLILSGTLATVGCAQPTPAPAPPAEPVADAPADIAAINAARAAHILDFIESLPQGWETRASRFPGRAEFRGCS